MTAAASGSFRPGCSRINPSPVVLFNAPEQSSTCLHGGDCEGAGLSALKKKNQFKRQLLRAMELLRDLELTKF